MPGVGEHGARGPRTHLGCRGLPSLSQMHPPGLSCPAPHSPAHSLDHLGTARRSPWQLRPLGASLYPDEGQLHWKLPGMLMQR